MSLVEVFNKSDSDSTSDENYKFELREFSKEKKKISFAKIQRAKKRSLSNRTMTMRTMSKTLRSLLKRLSSQTIKQKNTKIFKI